MLIRHGFGGGYFAPFVSLPSSEGWGQLSGLRSLDTATGATQLPSAECRQSCRFGGEGRWPDTDPAWGCGSQTERRSRWCPTEVASSRRSSLGCARPRCSSARSGKPPEVLADLNIICPHPTEAVHNDGTARSVCMW